MKIPATIRNLFLPTLISTVLVVALLLTTSLPQAMAQESGGSSQLKASNANGKVLYVSVTGNDAWSGNLAEPNADRTDGPIATLAHARDAIRSMQSRQPLEQPVTVYLRGGVYRLGTTLVFQVQDSGTPKCPITYAAYPGEEVVLSGGRIITGWKKAISNEQNDHQELWTAEVPGVKDGKWYFHQLFVDGQRRQRARSPNTGFYRADGQFIAGNPTSFKYRPGNIHPAWVQQGDVEIIGLEKWVEFRMPLKSVDTATSTATLSTARQEFGDDKEARYWVENAADTLDAPGEWFLDRRTGTLSYLAMPGEDVAKAQFTAPFLPQLVRMEGQEQTGPRPLVRFHGQ
jgi:hypothetical protein